MPGRLRSVDLLKDHRLGSVQRSLTVTHRVPPFDQIVFFSASRVLVAGCVGVDVRCTVAFRTSLPFVIREPILQARRLTNVDCCPPARPRLLRVDVVTWLVLEVTPDQIDPIAVLLPRRAFPINPIGHHYPPSLAA